MAKAEQPSVNSPEALQLRADLIQQRLRDFAAATPEQQQAQLKDLFAFIDANVTDDILQILTKDNPAANQKLTELTTATAGEQVARKGIPVHPWNGNHYIVAIGSDGTIVGVSHNQPNPAYLGDFYGNAHFNFAAPAVAKHFADSHLKALHLEGGIKGNIEYLEDNGFHYHEGVSQQPAAIGGKSLILSGSGCEPSKEALAISLGISPDRTDFREQADNFAKDPDLHFANAGDFDRVFCDAVVARSVNPSLTVSPTQPALAHMAARN